MQRWLSRLAFTFFILAALLAWDSFTALTGRGRHLPAWRIWVQFALALGCLIFGFAGIRARHLPPQDGHADDR